MKTMLNTPQGEAKDNLMECMIELAQESTYAPCDLLRGKVNVKISHGFLVINSLRLTFKGIGNIAIKGRREESCYESCIYLKKDWNLIGTCTTIVDTESSYAFQEILPPFLPTSVQSSKGSILYSLVASLEYLNEASEICLVKAVRGITVVEPVDLNRSPKMYFEPRNESEQRKFGWFACTGGQIRLNLTLERTAFVCGEAVAIAGRIENKSDKHIEKVNAVLQRRLQMGTDLSNTSEETFMEVQDVQEELLAMYVVPGANIRIDKRIHIPSCPPSTQMSPFFKSGSRTSQDIGLFQIRRRSTRRQSSQLNLKTEMRRIISISYNYLIRVKSAGADIIEILIPVLIGSKPLKDTLLKIEDFDVESFPGAIYRQCRIDKPVSLLDEKVRTLCNKAQLQHINKYPFYASLPTSSKQSKKLSTIAGNLRNEAKILNAIMEQAAEHRAEVKTLAVETL